MTREQEINLIADCAVPDDKYKEFKDGIIWGAKWADKTIIDKACEWLDKNITNYQSDMMGYIEYSKINDIIQDFRKAMEE